MAGNVYRRPRARIDLVGIWTYIADDSEAAADRILDALEDLFVLLADRPMAGRGRTDLADDLRSFAKGNYVVFYRPVPDGIEVVRVLSRYLDSLDKDFT